MKKRLIAAGLMLAMFTGTAAAVSSYTKTINVEYGVSLSINGQTPTLTDVNGKAVQPFVYDGTTYVPIRAVGENLGATVGYDEASNTASVSAPKSTDVTSAAIDSYNIMQTSNSIHLDRELMSFYLTRDIEDDLAKSLASNYDLFSSSVQTLSTAPAGNPYYQTQDSVTAKSELKAQYEAYQQAYAKFFSYKATGNKQDGLDFSTHESNENKHWINVKKSCDSQMLTIQNDNLANMVK